MTAEALERVAGGFKVSGYDFERGDKFLAKDGLIYYVLQAYSKIQQWDFVNAVVYNGKDYAIQGSVQVSGLLGREYLGVDIDGMAQALAIARKARINARWVSSIRGPGIRQRRIEKWIRGMN